MADPNIFDLQLEEKHFRSNALGNHLSRAQRYNMTDFGGFSIPPTTHPRGGIARYSDWQVSLPRTSDGISTTYNQQQSRTRGVSVDRKYTTIKSASSQQQIGRVADDHRYDGHVVNTTCAGVTQHMLNNVGSSTQYINFDVSGAPATQWNTRHLPAYTGSSFTRLRREDNLYWSKPFAHTTMYDHNHPWSACRNNLQAPNKQPGLMVDFNRREKNRYHQQFAAQHGMIPNVQPSPSTQLDAMSYSNALPIRERLTLQANGTDWSSCSLQMADSDEPIYTGMMLTTLFDEALETGCSIPTDSSILSSLQQSVMTDPASSMDCKAGDLMNTRMLTESKLTTRSGKQFRDSDDQGWNNQQVPCIIQINLDEGTPGPEEHLDARSPYLDDSQLLSSHDSSASCSDADSPTSVTSPSAPDVLFCHEPGCSATFQGTYRQSNLARHRRLYHRAGGPIIYRCDDPFCQRVFRRQDSRLKHHRRHHPNLGVRAPIRRA